MTISPKSNNAENVARFQIPVTGALATGQTAAARRSTSILGLLALRTVLRLGFIALFAIAVADLVDGDASAPVLTAPFAALAAALAVGWLADYLIATTELDASAAVRATIAQQLTNAPARNIQSLAAGETVSALQRFPRAVASLVVGHKAARILMALGPLLTAAALAVVSWQAAVLLLALTPLMIVFFALVGETIRKRAEEQERALGRLAGQFADRIRALPTIVANHAVDVESAKLGERLSVYAQNTMRVLRIAFLNAGVIDFIASLSIAMLAVFLGLGHLGMISLPGFSNLALWQSLFILMAAPEYFAPFRRYAEQYHAKAEGEAAATALDRLATQLQTPSPHQPQSIVTDLGWSEPGLTAITGPSGAGKTTLLRQLSGIDAAPQNDQVPPLSWISTDAYMPEGSLADAISWGFDNTDPARIEAVAKSVGLLDDALLPQGLATQLANGGENLSGGQRLRIATARALLSGRPVAADEPTAKLDRANADAVIGRLTEMARTRAVLVATHDPDLAEVAARRVDLARLAATR